MFGAARRDPRVIAPVGSYFSSENRLIEILESDYSGVIGADLLTDELVEVDPLTLMQAWTRRRPHPTVTAASWRAERELL